MPRKIRSLSYYVMICACLCPFLIHAVTAPSDTIGTKPGLHFLPESKIIQVFTADERAHRLGVQYVFKKDSAEFIGCMGGVFPVVNAEWGKHVLQFSVASTLYTTLKRSISAGDLINTDFFVDLLLDFRVNDHLALRTGMGHTSQHLSDDAFKKFGSQSINYVRDYYQLFGVYQLPAYRAKTYLGVYYNHNFKTTDLDNHQFNKSGTPLFQFGLEHAPFKVGKGFFYYAADFKFRGEFNYATTNNIQAGLKFSNAIGRTFRTALSYGSGYEERGQFYTQKRNFTTLGLYFEL